MISTTRRPVRRASSRAVAGSGGTFVASLYLNTNNFNSELNRAATETGNDANSTVYNAFINWIFFDAAAFNLTDGSALNAAIISDSTLLITDLDTYAAAYTP